MKGSTKHARNVHMTVIQTELIYSTLFFIDSEYRNTNQRITYTTSQALKKSNKGK
jgi:hypothetical protein